MGQEAKGTQQMVGPPKTLKEIKEKMKGGQEGTSQEEKKPVDGSHTSKEGSYARA